MIKKKRMGLFILYVSTSAFYALAQPARLAPEQAIDKTGEEILWFDALDIGLEGQGWPRDQLAHPYDRLPAKAKGVVREPVWNLSEHSAGLCVRFVSDSPTLHARWRLRNERLEMDHMPATGVSGLDLYAKDGDTWRWAATGRAKQQENEQQLLSGAPEGLHEYILYLPLYNGTERLAIGVKPGSTLARAPERPEAQRKPIVFYGTSITQGGCASRTGMAYPAIIGRSLGRPTINLGFSGNGPMELELGELIAEIDAAVYVLDCLPNMKPEDVRARSYTFLKNLREKKPDVPIVIAENIEYQAAWFLEASRNAYLDKNKEIKAVYDRLVSEGAPALFYVEGETLLAPDNLGTVDGTHPTDVGFMRMAEAFGLTLKAALR